MFDVGSILSFFKEVTTSLKFQIASAVSFGIAGAFYLYGRAWEEIALSVLFFFPAAMLLANVIEKFFFFFKDKKEKALKNLQHRAGLLGKHTYTHKLNEPWQDPNHENLAWIVAVDSHARNVYLTYAACPKCRSDLVQRMNEKISGYYLECQKCKTRTDLHDVGEARQLAYSLLQGDLRNNPRKYFGGF